MSDSSDWQLDTEIFSHLQQIHGPLSVDLFASFRKAQLEVFYSLKADPQATAIDVLVQDWSHHRPYCFSSICTHREISAEDQKRQHALCSLDCTNLASSDLVSSSPEHVDRLSNNPTKASKSPEESSGGKSSISTTESSTSGCMANIRKSLSENGSEFLNSLPLSSAHLGEKALPRLMNQHGEGGLAGVIHERWTHFQQP